MLLYCEDAVVGGIWWVDDSVACIDEDGILNRRSTLMLLVS